MWYGGVGVRKVMVGGGLGVSEAGIEGVGIRCLWNASIVEVEMART